MTTYTETETMAAEIQQYSSDHTNPAGAVLAIGGTGTAFVFLMSAYLLLAPSVMMMAVR